MTAEDTFEPPAFTKKTKDPTVVMQPPYHCHCTYKDYPEQKGNFYAMNGELFAANNGYFPVSKAALEGYYNKLVADSGDVGLALHRIAQILDLYINDDMIESIKASDAKNSVSRLAQLARKTPYTTKTYLDAMMDERARARVQPTTIQPTTEDAPPEAPPQIDPRAVELFGGGFSAQEYDLMLQHYDKLLKQFENADGLQEAIILNLCQIHTAGQIAFLKRDMDGFEKMQRLYNQTLKDERLKAKKTDSYGGDEGATWGTILATILQYAPGEAYQQDDLYKDFNGFDEYMRNTYIRSLTNYFGKTDARDPGFSLTDEEMLGDG